MKTVAGEVVDIRDGEFYLNWKKQDERYVMGKTNP